MPSLPPSLRSLLISMFGTACLALSVASQGWAQTAVSGMPEEVLPGLQPILKQALTQSPQMLQRSIDLAIAEANRYVSYSAFWPSVGGTVQYAASSQEVTNATSGVSSDSSGVFYSFNVSQSVFQWGAVKAQADISTLSVRISERQYAEAYRLLVQALRAQYIGLASRKLGLEYTRSRLQVAEKVLAVEEDKLANGALSPGGIIGPRLNATEARLQVDRAEADLDYARRMFSRLAGLDRDLPIEAIPSGVPRTAGVPPAADALLAEFLRNRGQTTEQAEIYSMQMRQADLNYKITRTRLYPKFSLYAGYSLSNSTSASLNSIAQVAVSGTNYGVTASWTIFDGFATRGAKLSALASRRSLDRVRASYEDSIMDSAQNLHRQLALARRGLELAEFRRDLAADAVRIVTDNVRLGAAAQSDLDVATGQFHGADLAAVTARADFISRWSDFVSLVGADPAMNNLPARYVRSQP